ncbi:HAD family hydrolase [Paracoccus sediminicola]|uniref:HAD family hydrolase n=1 Tax=Paracoccus sediminicola TaxID=3017783 RepID=UPI0022F06447|nr:HAD family phosphatase [Paracoccus sediminicola]WBU56313.1 HAD family phosphatase [Paracoccus sediminicola]
MKSCQNPSLTDFAGAVFDLDGTLVDSEPAWARAKNIVAERHGRRITAAQLEASIGRSMDDLVAEVFAPSDKGAARAIEEEIFTEADNWLPQLRTPIAGAAAFLRDVKGLGLVVAICSSSPERLIRDALAELRVSDSVDLVVSADPLPRRKPDPMPYSVTADRLGRAPARLIAFEDAVAGARSAKDAGLFTVAVGPEAGRDGLRFCDLRAPDYRALRRLFSL